MTTVKETTDLMEKNVEFLKAMGVTTISYSITDSKWKLYYVQAEQPKRKYYYGNNTKRIEGSTLEEVTKKLNDVLAKEVKLRLDMLERQAKEARKKADDLRKQADELEKSAESLSSQV